MSIGARLISIELALKMLDIWLNTPFDGGRHARRIRKITEIDSALERPIPAWNR
jgi:ribose 5-phosphate isomerase B